MVCFLSLTSLSLLSTILELYLPHFLPRLDYGSGVHLENSTVLVLENKQNGGAGGVKLFGFLIFFKGWGVGVQFIGIDAGSPADHLIHGGFAVQVVRAIVLGQLHLHFAYCRESIWSQARPKYNC